MARQKAIIVDIDGTLSIRGARNKFDFAKSHETDSPFFPVAERITAMAKAGYEVVFCTGREDKFREQTETFIKDCLPWLDFQLFMRKTSDVRKDAIVKRELYENKIVDQYEVLFILDDRNQVVDMWRKELNLPCFQVNYGDF